MKSELENRVIGWGQVGLAALAIVGLPTLAGLLGALRTNLAVPVWVLIWMLAFLALFFLAVQRMREGELGRLQVSREKETADWENAQQEWEKAKGLEPLTGKVRRENQARLRAMLLEQGEGM